MQVEVPTGQDQFFALFNQVDSSLQALMLAINPGRIWLNEGADAVAICVTSWMQIRSISGRFGDSGNHDSCPLDYSIILSRIAKQSRSIEMYNLPIYVFFMQDHVTVCLSKARCPVKSTW
jgi:hypothetical protein